MKRKNRAMSHELLFDRKETAFSLISFVVDEIAD